MIPGELQILHRLARHPLLTVGQIADIQDVLDHESDKMAGHCTREARKLHGPTVSCDLPANSLM
jgi:hypothetical protein